MSVGSQSSVEFEKERLNLIEEFTADHGATISIVGAASDATSCPIALVCSPTRLRKTCFRIHHVFRTPSG
jgi:hypothetical protein